MTSQLGKETIAIDDLLTNVSTSKGKQRMKFGHLIEYNKRNIFLEKSNTKFDGETIPDPSLKIKIELIFGSIV